MKKNNNNNNNSNNNNSFRATSHLLKLRWSHTHFIFKVLLKADQHATSFAYDCQLRGWGGGGVGAVPIMDYTGRLRSKGVSFQAGARGYIRAGISRVGV